MSRLRCLKWGVAAALAAAGLGWFLTHFELREVEEWVGYHGEARSNPLLVARRFLRKMGVAAENRDLLETDQAVLRVGEVLLIGSPRRTLTPQWTREVLAWVEEGGHLILAEQPYGAAVTQDALLQALGLEIRSPEVKGCGTGNRASVSLPGQSEPLTVKYSRRKRFFDPAASYRVLSGDDLGSCVLHQARGRGAITALCDAGILGNGAIGKQDHARLLWGLVHLHVDAARVWLVHNDDLPALPVWLYRHAPLALLASGLGLLILGWRAAARLGPLREPAEPARRSRLEHVDAAGQFLWKRCPQALVNAMQQVIERRIRARHAQWAGLDVPRRAGAIAAHLDLPESRVLAALSIGAAPRNELAFTTLIHDLQMIRRSL